MTNRIADPGPYYEAIAFAHELGYVTPTLAAVIRQCSVTTIQNKIASGDLPVRYLDGRTPLISLEDVGTLHLRYGWRRHK